MKTFEVGRNRRACRSNSSAYGGLAGVMRLLLVCAASAAMVSGAVHNPALTADSIILVSHPAESTPPVTISITWPYGAPNPPAGTLTATIQTGVERIAIIGAEGQNVASRSWSPPFPSEFQVRALAKSASINDVTINIQHDSGPIGSKILTVSAPRLTAPPETQDGSESGVFNIVIEPASPASISYEWLYVVPAGAGRAPTGEIFDDKTKAQPKITSAKWFAPTNNADRTVDGPVCTYKIKCKVTVGSIDYMSPDVDWRVWAYRHPVTNRPSISHGPGDILIFSISGDNTSLTSEVTSHGMTRNAASIDADGMLATNSFHGKIITSHEGRHVHQWMIMSPWSAYYSPAKVYQPFAGKKKTGTFAEITTWQNTMRTQAAQALSSYITLCSSEGDRTHHHREHDAHAVSNAVNPPFLRSDYAVEYPNVQTPIGNAP